MMLRLMKVFGVGLINALALLAVIGDVRRFERPEKLVADIGLNPGQRHSGTGKTIKLGKHWENNAPKLFSWMTTCPP